MSSLPLSQIQGIVLRGYRSFGFARHIVLAVTDPAAARTLLGQISGGEPASGLAITTAAPWGAKPAYTLNAGITYAGLQILGVPPAELNNFPASFQNGAIGQAQAVFDCGSSAPSSWVGGLGNSGIVHVLFSLFTRRAADLDVYAGILLAACEAGFRVTYSQDAEALPGGYVHFGYRDGISQPAVVGGPAPTFPYPAELGDGGLSASGDFLLGYPNTNGGEYSPGLASTTLGRNGSYGAFRILQQDVAGFHRFLDQQAAATGYSSDQLAAKFLGRWRGGVPLTLSPPSSPQDSTPPTTVPEDQLNLFLYKGQATGQNAPDARGLACPVGSHIRRGNPRDGLVAGGNAQSHRIMRRAMPYGPPFDGSNPNDGRERGLIGYFINADLANQFEFLMSTWMNTDGFTASGPIGGADPLIGDNLPEDSCNQAQLTNQGTTPPMSEFTIAAASPPNISLTGFSRFAITRGSAYCFLPGIAGLRYLAQLAG